jgi:2-polyprenyl-6-methoxyphenol hydroxylase-like FAD-dependent oxidoreductase
MTQSVVLIVGAGPTGLVLALWLTRLGVRVRIVDKNSEPGTTSRALAVQARTLELYQQVGIADAVIAEGIRAAHLNLWVKGAVPRACRCEASAPARARSRSRWPIPRISTTGS